MKRLNGAGTRAIAAVQSFTLAQKTIAAIGVAVLVLGGVALANWLGKPSMVPIYSSLSASDASAMTAQLDKDKVPYQVGDGGTILVPADKVNAERVAAAAAGIPSNSNGGYSLLDTMGVTASEFQQNVTYKRAIEGELAKTIESIDGVSSASVLLAIPQQTVFTDDKEDPKASVTLSVSQPLDSKQVGAVVHLVSAAYPGLTDANVTVTDQNGDTLSAGGASGSAADQASDYENRTRNAVQSMLDRVLGPGNATVTVAADVSNSSGTTRSETYTTPTGAPVLSESNNDQSYTGSGAGGAASGLLGNDTTSNGTGGVGTTTGGTTGPGNTFSQKQGVKNNAIDKITTEQTITPGTLHRQTVAVAVNQVPATNGVSLNSLTKMVSAAAGINLARGDSLSVNQVPFSTSAQKAATKALQDSTKAQSADQMTEIITTAIKVFGGLGLFIFLVLMLKKLFKRQEPQAVDGGTLNIIQPTPPADPALVGGMPTARLASAAAPTAVLGAQPFGAAPAGAIGTYVDPEFAQLQADVDALAASDPAQTAEYLRALMGERTG